ncbi:MAG TPA: ABC transporter ATP-binding protein [Candidatus Limnocylindria bacterium]
MSGTPPPALELRDLRLAYGATPVLDHVSLSVAAGETLAVLGPSGSGKTSLLYAIAGFAAPAAGEILVGGRLVANSRQSVPPERRDIGFVFQHYALWPHLTALETVAYPMRRRGIGAAEARSRATELLGLMGVAHLDRRRPAQLSGGEQQRVGVARALAREAGLLLLDEPTAHLDVPLRGALMTELAEQRARTGAAAVYATHDVGEALAVADRVAVLGQGRIAQIGEPLEVYERPVDEWVARLTGPASVLEATLTERSGGRATLTIEGGSVTISVDGQAGAGVSRLLVRPDWAALDGPFDATVRAVAYRGPHTDYALDTASGAVQLRADGPPRARAGEAVTWRVRRAWSMGSGR